MSKFAKILSRKDMKRTFFGFLACVLTCFAGCKDQSESTEVDLSGTPPAEERTPAEMRNEIIARVQQQSKLHTAECQVHKVVLFSDEATLTGLFDIKLPGERKVAVPIDVTLKGYVDFSEFSDNSIIISDSLCIITLPDPQVVITSSRVDHAATRQYVGMTRSKFSDAEIARLAAQGEDTIASHISQYGIVDRSRESCARTLVPLLTHMGFKESNIIVRFRKQFDDSEIRTLKSTNK